MPAWELKLIPAGQPLPSYKPVSRRQLRAAEQGAQCQPMTPSPVFVGSTPASRCQSSRPSSGMETGTTAPPPPSMRPSWNRAPRVSHSSSTTASRGEQTRSGARFREWEYAPELGTPERPPRLSGVSLPRNQTCQRIMLFFRRGTVPTLLTSQTLKIV